MTREEYAAFAMQALIRNHKQVHHTWRSWLHRLTGNYVQGQNQDANHDAPSLAKQAFVYADAMKREE